MTHEAARAGTDRTAFHPHRAGTDKGSRWQHLYKEEQPSRQRQHADRGLHPHVIGGGPGGTGPYGDVGGPGALAAPTDRRPGACLDRTLDTCAYRYDAWMLGLVHYQLERMRNIAGEEGTGTRQGIYLGAYGWLEEVDRRPGIEQVTLDGELRAKFQAPGRWIACQRQQQRRLYFAPR